MAEKKTKIDIFSGFLGAGKTTLIKKLIKEAFAGEQIVLIENEFGEIGIDGGFMREAGIQVNELNSGCICCSLVGDFREALKKVVETYHPDRILIEPSGVGKLSDVTRAVEGVAEDLPVILNSFVTVADVNKVKMYMKNFGEFYDDQVSHASCIILSRTGNASEEKVAAAVAMLAEKNPTATIVTTDWTVLTGAQIVSVMDGKRDLVAELLTEARAANVAHADEDEHEHHHHHHHDHDEDEHDHDCCCHHHHDEDDDEGEHEHHHHHDHDDDDHDHDCCHHHDDEDEHEHHHEHHYDEHGVCSCGHHHHHDHDADEVFTSWGKETAHKYSREDLDKALQALDEGAYGMILRAKGIVDGGAATVRGKPLYSASRNRTRTCTTRTNSPNLSAKRSSPVNSGTSQERNTGYGHIPSVPRKENTRYTVSSSRNSAASVSCTTTARETRKRMQD